jgi:hypothetical protein
MSVGALAERPMRPEDVVRVAKEVRAGKSDSVAVLLADLLKEKLEDVDNRQS